MRPFAFCSKISEIQFIRNDHGGASRSREGDQRIIQRSRPRARLTWRTWTPRASRACSAARWRARTWRTAFAAFPANDKLKLREQKQPSVAIVSSYNDMLSAHQPFEYFPKVIKDAVREVGAVAQFAGGVPAMCDGVTQGQPGMELSLFSRDTIAMSTAIALSHNMFDAALYLGICDKIVPGLLIGALHFGHIPGIFVPGGPMTTGISNKEKARCASATRRARPRAKNCSKARPRPTTAPAPAPSTAPPTATRC
jgi:phosphogluconate dehydratase